MSELDKKWLNCAYWGKCELDTRYAKQKKENKRLKEVIEAAYKEGYTDGYVDGVETDGCVENYDPDLDDLAKNWNASNAKQALKG